MCIDYDCMTTAIVAIELQECVSGKQSELEVTLDVRPKCYIWYFANNERIDIGVYNIRFVHRATRVSIQLSFIKYAYLISQRNLCLVLK